MNNVKIGFVPSYRFRYTEWCQKMRDDSLATFAKIDGLKVIVPQEGELDPIRLHVDRLVERLLGSDLVAQQVFEPAGAVEVLVVVGDGEAAVEVGVVAQPIADDRVVPAERAEDLHGLGGGR